MRSRLLRRDLVAAGLGALCGLASLAGAARAQTTPPRVDVPAADAAAPVITWTQISSRSYEAESPGLGTSKGYQSALGTITVYAYTMGIADWKDQLADPRLKTQMNDVIAGLREAERRGSYSKLSLRPVETVAIGGHEVLLLESMLEISGRQAWSATLLTVRSGRLLKFRMTSPLPQAANLQRALMAFAEATLPGL